MEAQVTMNLEAIPEAILQVLLLAPLPLRTGEREKPLNSRDLITIQIPKRTFPQLVALQCLVWCQSTDHWISHRKHFPIRHLASSVGSHSETALCTPSTWDIMVAENRSNVTFVEMSAMMLLVSSCTLPARSIDKSCNYLWYYGTLCNQIIYAFYFFLFILIMKTFPSKIYVKKIWNKHVCIFLKWFLICNWRVDDFYMMKRRKPKKFLIWEPVQCQ